jgi:hypothetical protein
MLSTNDNDYVYVGHLWFLGRGVLGRAQDTTAQVVPNMDGMGMGTIDKRDDTT